MHTNIIFFYDIILKMEIYFVVTRFNQAEIDNFAD